MFISPAFAQAASPFGGDNMLMSLLPFVLIFVIMYFLILRPQQKRVKQHQEMVKNVRRGDTVVTSGGLVGKVTKVVDDDQIEVEIADGRAGAADALDGVRRARQGRAGEGGGRVELIALAIGRRPLEPMLYFSRWKATAILLTTFLVCVFAVPNFLPEKTVQSWPKWAQRHIVLGLDLQGGSHILLEVDSNAVRKEKVETLRDDVRRVVRENRLGSPAAAAIRGRLGRVPRPRGRRSGSWR